MTKTLKNLSAFFGFNTAVTRENLPTLKEIQEDDSYQLPAV